MRCCNKPFDRLSKSNNLAKDAWTIVNTDKHKKPVVLPADKPSPESFIDL